MKKSSGRKGHRVLIDPYKFAAELLPLEFHSYTAYIRHRELPATSGYSVLFRIAVTEDAMCIADYADIRAQ